MRDDPDILQPQQQDVDLPFIIDWYRRAHDTAPALQRVAFDRWLPPGFWTLDRGEGVKVGDRAKILVGTYFFYYESQSNFNEPLYDSTAAQWNPALDDIVATPFVASEEPNAQEGTVVVWIEGRPSLLPNGIKALFPDPDNLREGYSLWDAVISTREAGEIIRFKTPSNGSSLVRLYVTRQIAQYRYPEHTELSIARLPVAVD